LELVVSKEDEKSENMKEEKPNLAKVETELE